MNEQQDVDGKDERNAGIPVYRLDRVGEIGQRKNPRRDTRHANHSAPTTMRHIRVRGDSAIVLRRFYRTDIENKVTVYNMRISLFKQT